MTSWHRFFCAIFYRYTSETLYEVCYKGLQSKRDFRLCIFLENDDECIFIECIQLCRVEKTPQWRFRLCVFIEKCIHTLWSLKSIMFETDKLWWVGTIYFIIMCTSGFRDSWEFCRELSAPFFFRPADIQYPACRYRSLSAILRPPQSRPLMNVFLSRGL